MGRRRRKQGGPHGVLVVDKPQGPTSHDVVAMVRRALDTGRVGHAGTLDPMATGVLVLGIGEGTKLVPWLTADDKSYEARVRLGIRTSSADAEGEEIERAAVPPLAIDVVRAAAESFLGEHQQRPPAVSAIRVDGERLYEKARRGEVVEAPERTVVLHSVRVAIEDEQTLQISLRAGKGFYVRSFGEMLAERIGTLGHLVELRRTASGRFDLRDARAIEAVRAAREQPEGGVAALAPLRLVAAATRIFATFRLTPEGEAHARHGRPVPLEAATRWGEGERAPELALGSEVALTAPASATAATTRDPSGGPGERLVAIARVGEGRFEVVRGFPTEGAE